MRGALAVLLVALCALPAAGSPDDNPALHELFAAAHDYTAFAVAPNHWIAVRSDQRSASCRWSAERLECIATAYFEPNRLAAAIDQPNAKKLLPLPRPLLELFDAANKVAGLQQIFVRIERPEPIELVTEQNGARFAIRRDGRWRVSSVKPLSRFEPADVIQWVDATHALGVDSLAVVVRSHDRGLSRGTAGCKSLDVRMLYVMRVEGDALVDVGEAIIGDDAITLLPAFTQPGEIGFAVGNALARDRLRDDCAADRDRYDRIRKLIGRHKVGDVLSPP